MVLTTQWPISEGLMKNVTTAEWTVLLRCFDSFSSPLYKNHLISCLIYLMPQLRRDEVEATPPIGPPFSLSPLPQKNPWCAIAVQQESPACAIVTCKLQIWSSKGGKKYSLISNIKSQFLSTTASTKSKLWAPLAFLLPSSLSSVLQRPKAWPRASNPPQKEAFGHGLPDTGGGSVQWWKKAPLSIPCPSPPCIQ